MIIFLKIMEKSPVSDFTIAFSALLANNGGTKFDTGQTNERTK